MDLVIKAIKRIMTAKNSFSSSYIRNVKVVLEE